MQWTRLRDGGGVPALTNTVVTVEPLMAEVA
jgi:hypothetical protein